MCVSAGVASHASIFFFPLLRTNATSQYKKKKDVRLGLEIQSITTEGNVTSSHAPTSRRQRKNFFPEKQPR